MAEPLTSSDVWRIERGWGASPLSSTEERKRFAAAGESPLSGENITRLAEGRGISPMASRSEKDAWVASEVMAGQRDPMDLPKEYGGLGDRPEATTRRGLRMQQEWDAQYKMLIDQQEAARQAAKEQREIEDSLRDRQLQEEDLELKRETRRTAQDIKHRTNQHVSGFLAGLNGGGVDSAGNTIPPLDPESPEYLQRRSQLIRDFPLATKNEEVSPIIATMDDIYNTRVAAEKDRTISMEEEGEEQAQINADIVKYNLTPEQQARMLVPNLPAGVVKFDPNKAKPIIAEAEKAIEGRKETKATEKESETRFDDYNKALATYEGMAGDKGAEPQDVAKARAAVRGAAAVLKIPKVANEDDLQNYNSGDRVLAPDGITVITIP
jgi:hypothetical protein